MFSVRRWIPEKNQSGKTSLALFELLARIEDESIANPRLWNMSDFPPTTDELLETFEDLQDWDEPYDFIIDLGRELPDFPIEFQTQENVVEGCMSTVWLVTKVADQPEQPLEIQADSDSIIVKGLIAILLSFYSGCTPSQIVESDVSGFLKKLGLNQHLSPQRRNGLFSMIKRLKALAAENCAA